jgi:hypothetical protein
MLQWRRREESWIHSVVSLDDLVYDATVQITGHVRLDGSKMSCAVASGKG